MVIAQYLFYTNFTESLICYTVLNTTLIAFCFSCKIRLSVAVHLASALVYAKTDLRYTSVLLCSDYHCPAMTLFLHLLISMSFANACIL